MRGGRLIVAEHRQLVAHRGDCRLDGRAARASAAKAIVIRATTVNGRRAIVDRREHATSACCTACSHLLRRMQTQRRSLRGRRHRERAAIQLRLLESLGQPGSHRRARLRRAVAVGLAQPARLRSRRATATTRAPTRRSASTARCSPTSTPTRRCSRAEYLHEGRGARRASSGRTASASISRRASARRSRSAACKTADPLDPAVRAWWKTKADEIYTHDPGFRRLPGEGELRGPARAAGLQAHARRRRQHARRRAWRRTAAS